MLCAQCIVNSIRGHKEERHVFRERLGTVRIILYCALRDLNSLNIWGLINLFKNLTRWEFSEVE
jgi:hypothetical protein